MAKCPIYLIAHASSPFRILHLQLYLLVILPATNKIKKLYFNNKITILKFLTSHRLLVSCEKLKFRIYNIWLNQLIETGLKPAHHRQEILEKWNFQPISSWKSGNFEVKKLGKVEIFGKNFLEKWKFQLILPWKSGNFGVKKLGKVEILRDICLEKWKF